jgi:predicted dehydrogenase
MKRIGLVGAGAVADFGHAPAIHTVPGFNLFGVFDPDLVRAQNLADKFGIPNVARSEAELYALNLDAVVIASPPEYHLANFEVAARHGVSVLCEKPLADTEENALAMCQLAEEYDVQLFTGFVYRFSPIATQIRAWIAAGIVGRVRSMRLVYLWGLHGQYMQDSMGKWIESPRWRGRMLEGGPLVDCGVHFIDLVRWWLGEEIVSASGAGAWVADYEAPDHVYGHLTTESGVQALAECSFTFGHTVRDPSSVFTYEIIGDGGVIRYDRSGWHLEARTGSDVHIGEGASEKNFAVMHHAFYDALVNGQPNGMPTAMDGILATRYATAITREIIDRRKA